MHCSSEIFQKWSKSKNQKRSSAESKQYQLCPLNVNSSDRKVRKTSRLIVFTFTRTPLQWRLCLFQEYVVFCFVCFFPSSLLWPTQAFSTISRFPRASPQLGTCLQHTSFPVDHTKMRAKSSVKSSALHHTRKLLGFTMMTQNRYV